MNYRPLMVMILFLLVNNQIITMQPNTLNTRQAIEKIINESKERVIVYYDYAISEKNIYPQSKTLMPGESFNLASDKNIKKTIYILTSQGRFGYTMPPYRKTYFKTSTPFNMSKKEMGDEISTKANTLTISILPSGDVVEK